MAKRAAQDEPTYNPIDQALVNAATAPMPTAEAPVPQDSPSVQSSVSVPKQTIQTHPQPNFTRPVVQTAAEVAESSQQTTPSNVVHMSAAQVVHPKPAEGRSRVSPVDPNERFQDRRIPLSPAEDAELERLITAFASEMGSKVKGTHVGRALFGIFMDAYDHVLDRGRRASRMKRPGNGDPIGLMKFEEHVRETIESGLRDYLTRGRGQQR